MPDIKYEAKYGRGPHLTVDVYIEVCGGQVLLIKRKDNGLWALPGGFVNPGERLVDAAIRELVEETKFSDISALNYEDCFVQDDPDRDPRSHIITVVHIFEVKHKNVTVMAGDDAAEARFFSLDEIIKPEFTKLIYADHFDSILKAHRRILLK